ncbi:MAG: aldehyde ferredoxin oxidoreductase C-terminal domain-containing protein [Halobacteriales archaeon]|nr:aldehyde ferredoxin oxidoreductase C-terminal domain-containing protein [Halobacteriales archaeon]
MTTLASRRVLRADLSERTVESERVPDRWLHDYIGGKGLGARYLYAELPPNVDPLGPENALLFMLGPLTGLLPGEQRYAAVTKSPLTGTFLDSYSGGSFPGTLAGALDDHLGVIVTGQADEPVRLLIEDGTATIEPAEEWGMDAVETCAAFPDAAVACIGLAGEHTVTYSTIASDGGDHHAGRGGAGAVMGAKRLKAVVARGEPPDGLNRLREAYAEQFAEDDVGRWLGASGTLESVDFANETGVLATRGWQEREFEGTDGIGIESAREAANEREYEENDRSTAGDFRIETADGESVPRGATPMTLGAGLGIDEFDAVAELGGLCDRLGMDVISAGSAVAWAIRATQEGIIHRDIDFGDPDGARTLLEEIAARSTPLGDALAAGVDAVATEYGGEELIPTIKRMELPAYDPRDAPSMALAYATSDRGACHRRSRPIEREAFAAHPWAPEDAARAVVESQNTRSVLWSLIADDFVGEVLWEDLGAEWLTAVGIEYSPDELRVAGERIWNLTRLFNVREGFSREDDALPALLGQPDAATDARVDPELFEEMVSVYYERRGWDDQGYPTGATLDRLDLLDVIDNETPVGVAPSSETTDTDDH